MDQAESLSSQRRLLLLLSSCIPLLLYLLLSFGPISESSTSITLPSTICSTLPISLSSRLCSAARLEVVPVDTSDNSVDLVFAYFDEKMENFSAHIAEVKDTPFLKEAHTVRIFIYNKGPHGENELRRSLELRAANYDGLGGGDYVLALPNVGREGGTYLHHMLSFYNSTLANLLSPTPPSSSSISFADHTYFLQPHLAWSWLARPRLALVSTLTGFQHFGPYVRSACGHEIVPEEVGGDGREAKPAKGVDDGAFYVYMRDLWAIFSGTLCAPGDEQLTAWSGQFVVSRKRILDNPYDRYDKIAELLDAPEDSWIHNATWGPNESNSPSNPAFGHYVERAWPMIFNCNDPTIADKCIEGAEVREVCACFD